MTIEYYPQTVDEEESSRIGKFLRKELRSRKDLKILVEKFLDKVKKSCSLKGFKEAEEIRELEFITTCCGRDKVRLQEMRIPIQRKGGVVRIYFIQSRVDSTRILLIDGEVKHKKPSSIKENLKKIVLNIDY